MEDECSEFFLTIPRAAPPPPRADPDKNPEKDSLEGDNKKEDNFTAVLADDDSDDEVGGGVFWGPPFFIFFILVDRDGADATFSDTGFFLYCHRFRDHVVVVAVVDRWGGGDGEVVDNKLISSSTLLLRWSDGVLLFLKQRTDLDGPCQLDDISSRTSRMEGRDGRGGGAIKVWCMASDDVLGWSEDFLSSHVCFSILGGSW